jgi:superfamily II DNA or RNA helicase
MLVAMFFHARRAGAVGINLTEANRVFILEPCLNPALEAQAIGRVHRLGQKRSVVITRLIMKDSVESRIVEMLKSKFGSVSTDKKDESETVKLACATMGSLKADKAPVYASEFDLLYGVESSCDESDEDGNGSSGPEAIKSSTFL